MWKSCVEHIQQLLNSTIFKLANISFVTALLTQPLKVHFILDPFKPPIHHILSGSMHRHTRVFMPSDILSKKAPFIFFFFYWHLSFKSVASLWMLDTRGRYHNRSIYKRGIITPKWCLQYIPTYISIHDIICTFVYTKVSFSRD